MIPTFLTSATVDVMKPGMENLRLEILLRVAGEAMRMALDLSWLSLR